MTHDFRGKTEKIVPGEPLRTGWIIHIKGTPATKKCRGCGFHHPVNAQKEVDVMRAVEPGGSIKPLNIGENGKYYITSPVPYAAE